MSEVARGALIDAAERLFAERGINGVSLREVGVAAGHRNNSAAQYHFGDRQGLLDAIFRARMGPIDAAREEMLRRLEAAGRQHDVRGLVEALVRPLAAGLGAQGHRTWYGRFLAQVLAEPSFELFDPPRDEVTAALRRLVALLQQALATLPEPVRQVRIGLATSMVVHAFADHERVEEQQAATSARAREVLATHLVDAVVGLLQAPVSDELEQALDLGTASIH